jgi:GET complex subunit GET2
VRAVRKDSASPSLSPAPQSQTPPIMSSSSDPSQIRAQEDFLRSMLRAQDPQQQDQAGDQQQQQMPEDPMMKLLASLTSGQDNTDPNNPTGLPFSPEDIQNATGVPSWATSLLMGGKTNAPPTLEERKTTAIWNVAHILFSILAGMYLIFVLGDATAKFGNDPPPPATVKNPFLIFVLGELLIHGSRILMRDLSSTKRGSGWYRILKDVGRDGSIVLFMLGAANWWNGTAS